MSAESNRLQRIASGVQEACWLAAACMVPLLFNPRGGDLAYQPFKFGVWVMLSLISAAAWMAQALGGRRDEWGGLFPLQVVLAWLGAACLLSTILSVDRAVSLWGAPETFQGLATQLSMLTMAALVAVNLRTLEQFERLAWVMILAGFAAGLTAVLQRSGFDPQHPELLGKRSHATAGHSIYLAGYLAMGIPLTLHRLLESRRPAGFHGWVERGMGGAILAVQLAGFVCAESRGPSIALCGMGLAFMLFHAVRRGARGFLLALGASSLLGGAAVVAVTSGVVSPQWSAQVPILKRFAKAKTVDEGVETYRAETWRHMPGMMVRDRPLPKPSGGSDPLHGFRPFVGYGPETLQAVLPQVRAWRGSDRQENRFHNLVWDQLFSCGILGLAGFLALWMLTFQRGFQALGWIGDRRSLWEFRLIAGGAAVLGAVACAVVWNLGFVGMGVLCGLAAGTLGFPASRCIRREGAGRVMSGKSPSGWIIALLAALVGHSIDMAFAFPTAPTLVMFCLMVAMIHGAHRGFEDSGGQAVEVKRHGSIPVEAAMCALGVVTLLFGFVHQYSHEPMSAGSVLQWSLFHPQPVDGRSSHLWTVPLALVLAGGLFPASSAGGLSMARAWRMILAAGAIGGGYAVFQAARIVAIGSIPPASATAGAVLGMAVGYENLFGIYLAVAGLLVATAAWGLARPFRGTEGGEFSAAIPAASLAFLLAVMAGWHFALRPLQANLACQWGAALRALGRPDLATVTFRRAILRDPRPPAYRGMLADSLLTAADRTQDPAAAGLLLGESEKVLIEGLAISDLNRLNFFLGELYLHRGLGEARPARDATAAQGSRAFARALIFEPHQEQVWAHASICDRLLLGDPAAADRKLERALALATDAPDVAAAQYASLGVSTPDVRFRAEFAKIAMIHLDRLTGSTDRPAAAKAKFEKARLLLMNREDPATAEELLLEAAPDAPGDVSWQAHAMLAEILAGRNDLPKARLHLREALKTAPAAMHEPIRRALVQLGGSP